MTAPKYLAFISYNHDSDERLATALQSSLSRFAKPWYRLRTMRVFRDKTSLSANPALWYSIEQALGESEFFLLLACSASAKSPWVQKEVQWWLQNRSAEKLVISLTDGMILEAVLTRRRVRNFDLFEIIEAQPATPFSPPRCPLTTDPQISRAVSASRPAKASHQMNALARDFFEEHSRHLAEHTSLRTSRRSRQTPTAELKMTCRIDFHRHKRKPVIRDG